jgi:cell division protein FtsI (penicillin-binding protein 3)
MTAISGLVHLVRSPPRNGYSGWRFAALALMIGALGGIMIWRLVSLQVLHPERYVEHGENQRIRSAPLAAERGSIVDRNNVELVVSSPRQSIWADPRLITDPAAAAAAIVAAAGEDAAGDVELLTRRLSNETAKFAWMARQLDDETTQAILDLELNGIYTIAEQARLTPSGSDVAQAILGRTDVDGVGVSGLEFQYDEVLTGEAGRVVVERGLVSGAGQALTIPNGRYELVTPTKGTSLILTLDRTIQFEVESLLIDHVARSGAASGTVVMSRPATGEILAMATVVRGDDGVVSVSATGDNRAVTSFIEPGSISKPLAIGALLEEGLATLDTQVEVADQLEVYDRVFTDSVRHQTEMMTVAQILENSSNVGTALLSERLGTDKMHHYLQSFGIGSSTGLGLPGETEGILHPADEWSGVALSSAAIGYGYAATPLQMLRAYNVYANDGLLVEPHLVSGLVGADGDLQILSPREDRRVVSEQTADTMTTLLAGVVSDGTGQLASVPGYEIAGKTGTARIAQPGGGYEDENGDVHLLTSFAGFLPASAPELSIIVVIEDPAEESSGGRLAAPLFGEISNFALQHLRIPPAASIREENAG